MMPLRLAPLVLLFLFVTGAVWGLDQKFLEPSLPISPSLKGQGGVSTANAEGWDALFVNPAAYASKTNSLTFLDVGATAFLPLTALNQAIDNRDSWTNFNFKDTTNPTTDLLNSFLTKYGIGAQATVGAGWVGNNLGVGFLADVKTYAKGQTLLGSVVNAEQTLSGIVGMAWPFDVGLGTLKLGGALRPLQKTLASPNFSDLLSNTTYLSNYTVQSGFGLGWDLGARWDFAGFKTGLVVRDVGSTVISFKTYTMQEWLTANGFPSGGSSTGTTLYRIPTVVALGTSWVPDMGPLASLFQPTLSLDFQVPIKDEFTQSSFWTWTHVGAEAKFLSFLSVRTGLNQGYFTFGLGARLFILDFNMAIYADELGRYSGLNRRSALAMEWAIRL